MILDGIFTMFSKIQYVAWAQMSINGGVDPLAAAIEFSRLSMLDDAVTDLNGRTTTDALRVAVKTADRITFRDAQIESQGYDMKGAETLIEAHACFRAEACGLRVGFSPTAARGGGGLGDSRNRGDRGMAVFVLGIV